MKVKFYASDHQFPLRNPTAPDIEIKQTDTFSAARDLHNPCCLNFASPTSPGGGYLAVIDTFFPIKTQEEDLFRRSTLPELMDTSEVRRFYPLDGLKGVYCQNVIVTKDANLQPIQPFQTAVVTVPAVINPSADDHLVKAKAKRILDIAAENGHVNLVLGAWGCGVFNNNPHTIASVFLELLAGFEKVVFAIPGGRNVQIFQEVFNQFCR